MTNLERYEQLNREATDAAVENTSGNDHFLLYDLLRAEALFLTRERLVRQIPLHALFPGPQYTRAVMPDLAVTWPDPPSDRHYTVREQQLIDASNYAIITGRRDQEFSELSARMFAYLVPAYNGYLARQARLQLPCKDWGSWLAMLGIR
jgi:hypothetical protein